MALTTLPVRIFVPLVAAAGLAVGIGACGGSDKTPTKPTVRAECRVPTTTSFVDSAQGRVVVGNFSFERAEIHVRAGQSVRWVHCGPETEAHTVTSDSINPGSGPLFDSGDIPKDQSYTRTFPTAGRFPYHCTPHPTMVGVVVVEP